MIDRQAIEQAVRAWVLSCMSRAPFSASVAPEHVVFKHQEFPLNLNEPRITIDVGGLQMVGLDGWTHTFNGAAPAGQEIEETTQGSRTFMVGLQAYSPKTVANAAMPTAAEILEAVQILTGSQSVRYALNQAGLAVQELGDVVRIPRVRDVRHEDLASLDSRFGLVQKVTERLGYFDQVVINDNLEP